MGACMSSRVDQVQTPSSDRPGNDRAACRQGFGPRRLAGKLGFPVASTASNPQAGRSFHQTYKLGKAIGKGSWGRVYAIRPRHGEALRPTRQAVKVMSLVGEDEGASLRLKLEAEQEAKIWKKLGEHDHIVQLFEVFSDLKLFYMVMEQCDSSLMERLSEIPSMSERGIARIFREMLLGVSHLHELRIVHRDIKPDNFLFSGSDRLTVKLCDFGFAAFLPRRGGLLHGRYGTAPYMSPEMVSEWGHSTSTDMWSLGATVYVLLYGEFPYMSLQRTSKAMKQAITSGRPEPKFTRTESLEMEPPSELAEAFVRCLLRREPERRWTADEALQHLFVRQSDDPHVDTYAEEDEPSSEDSTLAPVLRRARMTTRQFQQSVAKFTEPRSIDELLEKLQRLGALNFANSFSERLGQIDAQGGGEAAQDAMQFKQLGKRSHEWLDDASTQYCLSRMSTQSI